MNDRRRGAMTQPIRPAGAPTAPLEPVTNLTAPIEPVATYTASETIEPAEVATTEAAPEIVETLLPAGADVQAEAAVEAVVYSTCDEAPSAVVPLTVSFHERPRA